MRGCLWSGNEGYKATQTLILTGCSNNQHKKKQKRIATTINPATTMSVFTRLLNAFSAQPQQQLQQVELNPSILLYNTVAGRSYDVQFISSFSPKSITKERYSTDNISLTSNVALNNINFQTHMKLPKDPFGRMPLEQMFRNEFEGINVVICFLSGAKATESKLVSVLNKIRTSITVPKVAVAFVLTDPQSSRPLVETFCADNGVEFFCIDEFNPSQVVPVVQKLLSNLANQVGVTKADRFSVLSNPYVPRYPQLTRTPKNLPVVSNNKLEENLLNNKLNFSQPVVPLQSDDSTTLSAA